MTELCRICDKPAFVEQSGIWLCKECAMTPEEKAFIEEDNRLDWLAVKDEQRKGMILYTKIWNAVSKGMDDTLQDHLNWTKNLVHSSVMTILCDYHIYIEASDGSLETVKL